MKQHDINLDVSQAYNAMFLFLERYWERGLKESGDIAALLTNMDRGNDNGLPLDQAQWDHWLDACNDLKKRQLE